MQESIDTIWVIDCVRAVALSSCVWFDKKAPIRTVCYYRACVLFGNWLHLFDGERWDWWRVKPWRIRTPRALDSMQSAACYLRCRKTMKKQYWKLQPGDGAKVCQCLLLLVLQTACNQESSIRDSGKSMKKLYIFQHVQ